jgi:hypothetical protein
MDGGGGGGGGGDMRVKTKQDGSLMHTFTIILYF